MNAELRVLSLSLPHMASCVIALACFTSEGGIVSAFAGDEDIPVTILSNQLIDVKRPTQIFVHRDADLYQQTINALAANRREFEGIPDAEILTLLLEHPTKFEVHNEQHKRVVSLNPQKFHVNASARLIPSISFADAMKIAQLLAAANDKMGFDFLVERLEYPKKEDLPKLCHGSYIFPVDWLTDSPAFKAGVTTLLEQPGSRPQAANVLYRMGDKQPYIDLCFDQYETRKSNMIYRGSALKSLVHYAPSDRVLDMLEETLTNPATADFYDGPDLVRRFIESDNPVWQQRAYGLCETLGATKPGMRYHILLCELGGPEFADYFRASLGEISKSGYALKALLRVLPGQQSLDLAKKHRAYEIVVAYAGADAVEYLQGELKSRAKNQFNCLRLAKLLTPLLDGAPDPESEAILRRILPKVYDYLNGRRMIEQMVLMGATDAEALEKTLRRPNYNPVHTDKHWEVDRITQQTFVDYLNASAGRRTITTKQARDASEFIFSEWRARPFASMAMQAAGIGRQFELDMIPFEALPCLTADYCELAGDDFKPDGVALVGAESLRIAWKDRVFEFAVDDNSTWYDPITHTDMLNTILANEGQTSKRFFVFDTDLDYMIYHVAYLEPKIAKELVDKFHLVIVADQEN